MRKLTKGLLVAIVAVSLGWSLLSSLYTHEVAEKLSELRRDSRNDVIYLRCRIRELESELSADLLEQVYGAVKPTDDPVQDESSVDTSTQNGTSSDKSEAITEEATVPTHESPETQRPEDSAEETRQALYLLAEHEGRIGVFDAGGELLRTLNVFVMTLPTSDREALTVGIPAYSWQEMCELTERYE